MAEHDQDNAELELDAPDSFSEPDAASAEALNDSDTEPDVSDDEDDDEDEHAGREERVRERTSLPEGAGQLGDLVGYTSTHKGCIKVATVVFHPDSFKLGTRAPQITAGTHRHLRITGMNHDYRKHDVRAGHQGEPGTWFPLSEFVPVDPSA
jgi:hypothetical protein